MKSCLPLIKWLNDLHLPADRRVVFRRLAKYWVEQVDEWITTRGPLDTIARLKAIRLHSTKFLAGEPLKHSVHPAVGLNRKGIPKGLGPLQPLLHGDTVDKRFLMTLLLVSREIKAWNPVDLSPVTAPYTGTITETEINEIADLVSLVNPDSSPLDTDFESLHLSTKMGPQGLALDYSVEDLKKVQGTPLESDIHTLGGEPLKECMEDLTQADLQCGFKPLTERKGRGLRRLSVKKDKEGKSRVFAILDYWSQTALKPLHDALLSIIRKFKADCTFDQSARLGRISPNPTFHSIDLTNATDRFPVKLQQEVLSRLIGPKKAMAWRNIMVALPFLYPATGEYITYSTGQPMGAYSSWPLFTLCHHLVVQHAARLCGVSLPYTNYMLLGDDIVLGDSNVATCYLQILTRLGVSTSSQKTHTSSHSYEFAKRWYHYGEEVTGIPLSSILNYQGPSSVLAWLSTIKRNWHLPHQAYSRDDFVRLLAPLGLPVKKFHLEVLRTYESALVAFAPGEETEFQCRRIFSTLLKGLRKCHDAGGRFGLHSETISAVTQAFSLSRIRVANNAIVSTVKAVNEYRNLLLSRCASSVPEDSGLAPSLPSLVSKHPAVSVALAYARGSQKQMDRIRDLIAENKKELILSDPPVLGFNPMQLTRTDRDDLLFYIHSRLPKELKGLAAENLKLRNEAMSGENPTVPYSTERPVESG